MFSKFRLAGLFAASVMALVAHVAASKLHISIVRDNVSPVKVGRVTAARIVAVVAGERLVIHQLVGRSEEQRKSMGGPIFSVGVKCAVAPGSTSAFPFPTLFSQSNRYV